jgi:Uma2 family endonuclease
MQNTIEIPSILVYEEFDGHPIYKKGYRNFMLGLSKIEEINMGSSILQWFLIDVILKFLHQKLPNNFHCGSSELGLNVSKNTNFSADIAVYRPGEIEIGFNSLNYSQKAPNIVIEVDIRVEESDFFQNEEEYFHRKTQKLLEWGVEKVVWVFSTSKMVLIAENLQEWRFLSWEKDFKIIDDLEINIWNLMLESGFKTEA